jgi:hypothetical protein
MVTDAWATQVLPKVQPRRRVRGLAFPAIPSWPLLAQVGGSSAALAGVWMQWGTPIALVVGGVGAVLVGMLRESGRI